MRYFLTIIGLLFFLNPANASGIGDLFRDQQTISTFIVSSSQESVGDNPRVVSMLLTLAVGPFGGHRIYLGTNAKVPIFYALTLGGGLGLLPIIDFFCITFTKDLSKYIDNDKIFMWAGK